MNDNRQSMEKANQYSKIKASSFNIAREKMLEINTLRPWNSNSQEFVDFDA